MAPSYRQEVLTLPVYCGCSARVEWRPDGLWLLDPELHLGRSLSAAMDTVRRTRRRCPSCQAKAKARRRVREPNLK